MSSRDTTNILRQNRASREPEFNPHNDRRGRRFDRSEINKNEDVIVALESAYENERARQVTEWETIGRLTFRQAA
jgi:hypothetical protein